MARNIVFAAAAAWIVFVVLSLLALGAAPQGDSFLRGFNRVEGFVGWQAAALVAAIAAAVALRWVPAPGSKAVLFFGVVPLVLSTFTVIAVAGIVAWTVIASPPPAPADPPRPAAVTAPN